MQEEQEKVCKDKKMARKRIINMLFISMIIVILFLTIGTVGIFLFRPEIVFCLLGFPGVSDFDFDVAEGYQLVRTSAHSVMITPKKVWTVGKDEIPPEVVRVAWNERFVIAERIPSKVEFSQALDYWIIDTSLSKVFGPFDPPTFAAQRITLGVPDTLALKSVSSCNPWWNCFRVHLKKEQTH